MEHLLSLELPAGDRVRAICWQQTGPSPGPGPSQGGGAFRAVVGTVQNNIHVLTYLEGTAAARGGEEPGRASVALLVRTLRADSLVARGSGRAAWRGCTCCRAATRAKSSAWSCTRRAPGCSSRCPRTAACACGTQERTCNCRSGHH